MADTYEDRLRWYQEGRFTADDVMRASGVSEGAQRLLLKLGILRPIPQARTKQRLLGTRMVKRAAVVGTLNSIGLSLPIAGHITYASLALEDWFFEITDPLDAYYDWATPINKVTGLPERRATPHARENWFKPGCRQVTEPGDYKISIIDSRFVVAGVHGGTIGELSADQSEFLWWKSAMWDGLKAKVADGRAEFSAQGAVPSLQAQIDGFPAVDDQKTIRFSVKEDGPRDHEEARAAKDNPVTISTVQVGLALRLAMRRLMLLDDASEAGR